MTFARWLAPLFGRRRLAALFAVLCVGSTLFERLLSDADGIGATVTHSSSASVHEDVSSAPADAPAPQSPHTAHVDHCGHAHVFASGTGPVAVPAIAARGDAPVTATAWVASDPRAPQSRPPIA